MRHAKSDWGVIGQQDHQRALNPRGQRDAPRMGTWLAEHYGIPDLILASTAVRVQETLRLMMSSWTSNPPILSNDALYLSTPDTILKIIRSDAVSGDSLLVVAHNPGLQALISQLSGRSIDLPTAAMAIFDLAVSDWSERFGNDDVRLIDFVRPKGLEDEA